MSNQVLHVLFISPTPPATGNLSTVSRLQSHFLKQNINSTVCSITQLEENCEMCSVAKINKVASETHSCGIILLHAYKSGSFMLCSCSKNCKLRVRYGVVFGGTDLNKDVKDKRKCSIIEQCIKGASFSVAFTHHLKEIALSLYSDALVFVMGQALDYDLYSLCSSEAKCLKHMPTEPKRKPIVFVLPCSIRPVKDPLFVVKEFFKWATSLKHICDVRLLILGNVTERQFGSQFLMYLDKLQTQEQVKLLPKLTSKIPWLANKQTSPTLKAQPADEYDLDSWISDQNGKLVQHLPSLTRDHFHRCLQSGVFYALINSSLSEGMASVILEAMALGVSVLARDLPSNKVIVEHGYNGLLFKSGADFVNQADKLLRNDSLRQILIKNAKTYIMQHHNPQQEADFYISLAKSTFL